MTPQQRERKIILSRFSGSKISDALRADRDKQFEAKPVLLDASEVFAMPDLQMEQLFGDGKTVSLRDVARDNTATLFTVSFTQHARKQLGAIHSAFLDTYGLDSTSSDDRVPGVGLVDCSYANGMLFYLAQSLILPGVRAVIPEAMQPYACAKFEGSERKTEGFCFDAKIHNRALQCSYLLDSDANVRWWMHSDVTDDELEAMIRATNTLMTESLAASGHEALPGNSA